MEIWWESKEDCLWLVYYMAFVGPLHTLLIMYLERQGKLVTPSKAMIFIGSLTLMSAFLPLLVRKKIAETSPYRILSVHRYGGNKYAWAQQYGYLKQYFASGQMSAETWQVFDSAYDKIYDDSTRQMMDVWGPNYATLLRVDMPYNIGLFYVLWIVGIYATTAGRKYTQARDLATGGLLIVLVFEMSIRFMGYNPQFYIMPQTTPYELIMLVHALFPAWIFGYASFKRIFFVDMLQHKQACLQYTLANNKKTLQSLGGMRQVIASMKEAAAKQAQQAQTLSS
ncbi:hypothetical protein ACHHYP_20321 [Achlya hypogyna]|uniref:Transmembrane protein n=1 Tax=Achlya hypogyna TaxID=1202772 RepID=A0A1V9ZMK7_ACHHY|nr:hypothetical protein ACHHYP_20321 [Achlya hypogyna]